MIAACVFLLILSAGGLAIPGCDIYEQGYCPTPLTGGIGSSVQTTRTFCAVWFYSQSDPSGTNLQRGSGALGSSLPQDAINPCAYEGSIAVACADDFGDLAISSTTGTSSAHKPNDGTNAGSMTIDGGSFDPQQAVASWSVANTGGRFEGLEANVQIKYRSQNGYLWDGTTCAQPASATILSSVNDTSPLEGTSVALFCHVENGDAVQVVAVANASEIAFEDAGMGDGWANFTFNVGGKTDLQVNCTLGSISEPAEIIRVGSLPPAPEFTDYGVTCAQSGLPKLKAVWTPVAGAASYAVYVDGIYNLTVKDANFSRTGFAKGSSHNLSVMGITSKGQSGAMSQNITATFVCPPPSLDMPDHFHRAYFARAGDKSVAANWNSDGAVIIYQKFVTDFSTIFPNYLLASNSRQRVQLEGADPESAADVRAWRTWTSGLRIDPAATGERPTA
jgi:hypothetical protein